MLYLDAFSYCKATNTCCIDLIFRNLFFCQQTFLRIQMQVILTLFNTRTYTLGVRRTPNQTDSEVTFCDQRKIANNDWKIIMATNTFIF